MDLRQNAPDYQTQLLRLFYPEGRYQDYRQFIRALVAQDAQVHVADLV